MSERWLPVPGFEGIYEVSDLGRVRSLDREVSSKFPGKTMRLKGKLLKPQTSGHRKHFTVALHCNGTRNELLVHRIVLTAFVGECPPGLEGCHQNDDAADNTLRNLRWDTRRANLDDMVANGRNVNSQKTHCPKKHHPYDLLVKRNGRTYRACSTCRRDIRQAYLARKAAAPVSKQRRAA